MKNNNNRKELADLSLKYKNIQYAYDHGMELLIKVATKNLLKLQGTIIFQEPIEFSNLSYPIVGISIKGENIFIDVKDQYGSKGSYSWEDDTIENKQKIQIYQEVFKTKIYEKINYRRS